MLPFNPYLFSVFPSFRLSVLPDFRLIPYIGATNFCRMPIDHKARFLHEAFVPLLQTIPSTTAPLWGKMNLQQMIEHFGDAVRMSSGRLPAPRLLTPEESLPKMQAFMFSDKPFKENTANPLMPETPAPVRFISIEAAINELDAQLDHFFAVFKANPSFSTLNPFFGVLDYEGNVQLLYKHAVHHLRQFGVEVAG